MPGYRLHLAGGAACTGGALYAAHALDIYQAPPLVLATLLAVGLMTSLFPDVDTDSKGQRLFYLLLLIVDIGLMIQEQYKWAAILGFAALLPAVDAHRGWTHTWWAMLVVPLPIIILPMTFLGYTWEPVLPYYLAAVTGYLSHLLLDTIA